MAATMNRDDLVGDLKRSLHDAAGAFDAAADADFDRHLAAACLDMGTKRPRTLLGLVTLVAEQDSYPLNLADFDRYKTHQWATRLVKPWLPCNPGAVPRVRVEGQAGAWQLVFEPAPSAAHLAAYGSAFRFWYFGLHKIGPTAAETTIAAADRQLLLLRAQAEALRELSMRNINKPVQVRDGFSGAPRNSTPAALYAAFLAEWKALP